MIPPFLRQTVLVASALVLALCLAAGPTNTQAVTSVWTTTDGDYNTAGNWDIGLPGLTTNWAMSAPGSTYTVTWSANITNYAGILTGANQNVTFDLGGYTHTMNQAVGYRGDEFLLGNPGDNITLTVSNGTINIPGGNPEFYISGGNTLVVTNGGRIYTAGGWISAQGGGTMLMSGPGSYGNSEYGGQFEAGSTGIVNNAAGFLMTPTTDSAALWLIDAGFFTNRAGGGMLHLADSTIRVVNGGRLSARTGDSSYFLHLGFGSGDSSRLIVGNDGPVSMVNEYGIVQEWDIYDSTLRGNTDVIASTNGIVQIHGVTLPWVMYRGANSNVYGRADWRVRDGGYVTLRGGALALNTNTVLGLTDNNANTSGSSEAGTAILRGFGTISNYNAGANFKVLNHGVIRPGDYGYEIGTHSNIAAMGTINMVNGDLLMTNPLSQVGAAIAFEFSDTALDQINITGGSAWITGGSNVFALAAGSPAPSPGVKWGLGTYDFLVASNLVWQPEYSNLTNVLAGYGLVQNLDYRFGVVDTGSFQALRLEFVPEPSTIMLWVVGGLLLWRVRGKQPVAKS